MPTGSPQFNCGEYRPGQQPINIPPISQPNPPIIVPGNPGEPRWPQLPVRIPPVEEPLSRPVIFPGAGGSGGGSSGGSIPVVIGGGGPITHPGAKYKCNSINYYCPDDSNLPVASRRVILTRRFCVICYPLLDPETGTYRYENDCIYTTLQQCQSVCMDLHTPQNCISVQRSVEVEIPSGQGEPPGVIRLDPGNIINNSTGVISNFPESNQNVLYNPVLNLFNHPVNPGVTNVVVNNRYPQVFKATVAEEVAYLLNHENSISNWSEQILQNLTLGKIEFSLKPALVTAFTQITYPGGLLVGKEPFLLAIKRHLLTGTMAEFQPGHYLNILNAQTGNQRISINSPRNELAERAALGIIQRASVPVDTSKLGSIELLQVRRQRRLNEDIGAKLLVCPLEEESGYMYSENAGVCLETFEGANLPLQNGAGDGYYLYFNTRENDCIPFSFDTNVQNAFYVQNEVRNLALRMAGHDSGITLTAESLSQNELTAGDTNSITFEPLYMVLDLSSVSGIPGSNPLIDRTSANYRLITDQSEINEHTDSNGFAVTRVNLDYRDPIYRYAKESSSINLQQNDITFRAFDENAAVVDRSTLSRNIPFGLIVTPVNGSKNNPFNGFSKIQDFGSTITRSINMVPSIEFGDKEPKQSQLKQVNLMDEGSLRVGVKEPNDAQNITFRFYASSQNLTDSILSTNNYQSVVPEVSSYGMSYLVKDVIDYLIDTQDPEVMSWYDVYSRMPINKFGEFLYDNNQELLDNLSTGFRGDVKIKHILNRMNPDSNPVLDTDSRVILQR